MPRGTRSHERSESIWASLEGYYRNVGVAMKQARGVEVARVSGGERRSIAVGVEAESGHKNVQEGQIQETSDGLLFLCLALLLLAPTLLDFFPPPSTDLRFSSLPLPLAPTRLGVVANRWA